MIERKCKQCGKKFFVWPYKITEGKGIFHNLECYKKYNAKEEIKKKCLFCGKVIITTEKRYTDGRGKFCNQKCQGLFKTKTCTTKVKCAKCGIIFNRSNGAIKKTLKFKKYRHYCSKCARGLREAVVVKCKGCDKTFPAYDNQVTRPLQKFHSDKCRRIYEKKRKVKTCKYCGKKFITNSNKSIFHSQKCFGKYVSLNGIKYPKNIRKKMYKEYKTVIGYLYGHGESCKGLNINGIENVSMLARKTMAIKRAFLQGTLNETILNHIKKGATHEAYI